MFSPYLELYTDKSKVVFDEANDHRRKSSLVPSEAPSLSKQPSRPDCFVHSLLEGQGKDSKLHSTKLDSIEKKDSHESIAHSRLLTKKQLSDMAWAVRELAKKLGSLKLKLNVQTVFLLTKAHDEELIGYTREVTKWLLSKERDTSYTVYVENTLKDNKKFDAKSILEEDPSYATRLRYWTAELCQHHPHTFDFVVTVSMRDPYSSWC
jgi:NAD+ kinase